MSVNCCCITNDPKTSSLKQPLIFCSWFCWMAIYSGLKWYVLQCVVSTVYSSYIHLNLLMIWLGQISLEWLIYIFQASVIWAAHTFLSLSPPTMWSFSSHGGSSSRKQHQACSQGCLLPREHLNFRSSWSQDLEVTVLFLLHCVNQNNLEYNSRFSGSVINCLLNRGLTKSSDRGHTYRNGINS